MDSNLARITEARAVLLSQPTHDRKRRKQEGQPSFDEALDGQEPGAENSRNGESPLSAPPPAPAPAMHGAEMLIPRALPTQSPAPLPRPKAAVDYKA